MGDDDHGPAFFGHRPHHVEQLPSARGRARSKQIINLIVVSSAKVSTSIQLSLFGDFSESAHNRLHMSNRRGELKDESHHHDSSDDMAIVMKKTERGPGSTRKEETAFGPAPILSNGACGISAWMVDLEGKTLSVDERTAQMLGIPPSQMIGCSFTDSMPVPQRERALACVKKGQPSIDGRNDFQFLKNDGRSVWLSLAVCPVSDSQGRHVATMLFASDVTADRMANDELQQAQRMAQATLDGLTAHVCVLDAKGTILAVNRAWSAFADDNGASETTTGVGVDYLGVCANACGPGGDESGEFVRGLRDVLEGRRDKFEKQYPCHSPNEQRWFLVNVSSLEGCDPARAVVAHQSVTTRVLAEARVRESQKLESLGTLAGGIAHDFNNILAAILGNASLAMESPMPRSPARERLEQILVAGKRGRQLVHRILAFSRRQRLSVEPLALRPMVEETLGLLRGTLPTSVRIIAELGDAPVVVLADASQIQQVLMNLVINGWHALQGRAGTVTVSLAVIPHDAGDVHRAGHEESSLQKQWALLTVADDGEGMEKSVRERIFEPFFTTKRPGSGTGLGLSIVHGIVAEHGGSIRVDTSPGAGSAFHVQLPVFGGGADAPVAARFENKAAPTQGCRVVLIDDDTMVGAVTQAVLERAGCLVRYFNVPTEAVQVVRTQPWSFDAVVTDYSMPMLSGLEVASEMAAIRPELPVILLSGYVSDDVVNTAAELGVRSVLHKESAFEDLADAVGRAIADGRR